MSSASDCVLLKQAIRRAGRACLGVQYKDKFLGSRVFPLNGIKRWCD